MGHAIEALPVGVRNVRDNPMLVVLAAAVMVGVVPLVLVVGLFAAVLSLVPVVGQLLARLLLAVPLKVLLFGGMVGAAAAGFRGDVTVGDYTDAVTDNAKSLGGAFVIYEGLLFVVVLGFGLVLFLIMFSGAAAVSTLSDPSAYTGGIGLAIFGGYGVLLLVVVVLASVFQFLDVAVVLGDEDAVDAFKECLRLVRTGPVSVAGYTVARFTLGSVVVLPGVVLAVAGAQVVDLGWIPGALVTLVLYPLAYAVVMSYHAAYYGVRLRAR